jgi:hypothetical protein
LNDLPEDFNIYQLQFTSGCKSSIITGNAFNIHSGGISINSGAFNISTQRFENALNFYTAGTFLRTLGANDCLYLGGRVNHLAGSLGDRRFNFGAADDKGIIVVAGGLSIVQQEGDDLLSCWEKTSNLNGGTLVIASDVTLPYLGMSNARLVIDNGAKFNTWGNIRDEEKFATSYSKYTSGTIDIKDGIFKPSGRTIFGNTGGKKGHGKHLRERRSRFRKPRFASWKQRLRRYKRSRRCFLFPLEWRLQFRRARFHAV